MKKKSLIYLIPLVVTSITLFSCNKGNTEPVIKIEKTHIEQTYEDYIKNTYYRLSSSPCLGETNILVIPIWFNDSNFFINKTCKDSLWEDIEDTYFGTEEDTGWESTKTFYEKESFGKLHISGTVSEWLNLDKSFEYYGTNTDRTYALVESSVDWFFTNHPEKSRSDFDKNEDGYLDGVVLIYAAPDYSQSGMSGYSNLWAYTSWLQQAKNYENPVPNAFFWASYDFLYDTDTAYERTGKTYASGDTSFCNLDAHTFIHESGHMLGLQDYYDYDGRNNFAGCFSMQDHNIGAHDPYSVMSFGWADPYIPTIGGEITIKSFQKTHDLILLTPKWNKLDSPFDEYLLLELFTSEGLNEFDCEHSYRDTYPKGPSEPGIRLWHVDSRLMSITTGLIGNNAKSKNIYLATNNNTYSDKMLSNYNLLQLIRNDPNEVRDTNSYLSNEVLFKEGSNFTIERFDKQFNKNKKLDSFMELGWSFSVKKIYQDSEGVWNATISLKKLA